MPGLISGAIRKVMQYGKNIWLRVYEGDAPFPDSEPTGKLASKNLTPKTVLIGAYFGPS
jgi:hypothetical protein